MGSPAGLRLLLDTHIWLWTLQDPKRLGKRIQQEPRDPATDLWLSPISTWEALTLHAEGRIRRHGNLTQWVAHATAPFQEAQLTHEIALGARQPRITYQDPADRFLAATAQVRGLTLVTKDTPPGSGRYRDTGNR